MERRPSTETIRALVRMIRDVGFCVVPKVISLARCAAMRRALLPLLEAEKERHLVDSGHQRVVQLSVKSPLFLKALCHPLVIAVWQEYLGRDMICSTMTSNSLWPGSTEQYWHVDHPYWTIAQPYPTDVPLAGQTIWMIDDFTEENGATAGIAGSHRRPHLPGLEGRWTDEATILEGERGSVILADGAWWHTSRPNRTDQIRSALLVTYIRGYCVTQEDLRRQLAELERPSRLVRHLFGGNQYQPTRGLPY